MNPMLAFTEAEMAMLTMLVGVVVALVRLVEGLINSALNKKKSASPDSPSGHTKLLYKEIREDLKDLRDEVRAGRGCGLSAQQAQELHDLFALHNRVDQDGTPIWYVPRSWADLLQKIIDQNNEFASNQHDQNLLLKQLQEKLRKLDK